MTKKRPEPRSDDHVCPRHPRQAVTARCVRFDRRFCDLDFQDPDNLAECLSDGSYCEFRKQCLVWEKVRQRKRRAKKNLDRE